MRYHGVPNWPSVWTTRGEIETGTCAEGGVVRDVFLSRIEPLNRLFIITEHEGNEYIGCVLFDDVGFCGQIHKLFYDWRGRTIKQHRAAIRALLAIRESTIADQQAVVAWLVAHELSQTQQPEALRAAFLTRCRALGLEPPTPDRLERHVRS